MSKYYDSKDSDSDEEEIMEQEKDDEDIDIQYNKNWEQSQATTNPTKTIIDTYYNETLSTSKLFQPKFCDVYDNFILRSKEKIDLSTHLLSLCLNYLISFCCWARESNARSIAVHKMLDNNVDLRPEVRNGLSMILIYCFSAAIAREFSSEMFTVLQDSATGLGIVNKTSLRVYNDPYNYFNFIKSCISGLIDAGAIPENERLNQPKKPKRLLENKEELTAYMQVKLLLVQMISRNEVISVRLKIQTILTVWQQRAKTIRGHRFSTALAIMHSSQSSNMQAFSNYAMPSFPSMTPSIPGLTSVPSMSNVANAAMSLPGGVTEELFRQFQHSQLSSFPASLQSSMFDIASSVNVPGISNTHNNTVQNNEKGALSNINSISPTTSSLAAAAMSYVSSSLTVANHLNQLNNNHPANSNVMINHNNYLLDQFYQTKFKANNSADTAPKSTDIYHSEEEESTNLNTFNSFVAIATARAAEDDAKNSENKLKYANLKNTSGSDRTRLDSSLSDTVETELGNTRSYSSTSDVKNNKEIKDKIGDKSITQQLSTISEKIVGDNSNKSNFSSLLKSLSNSNPNTNSLGNNNDSAGSNNESNIPRVNSMSSLSNAENKNLDRNFNSNQSTSEQANHSSPFKKRRVINITSSSRTTDNVDHERYIMNKAVGDHLNVNDDSAIDNDYYSNYNSQKSKINEDVSDELLKCETKDDRFDFKNNSDSNKNGTNIEIDNTENTIHKTTEKNSFIDQINDSRNSTVNGKVNNNAQTLENHQDSNKLNQSQLSQYSRSVETHRIYKLSLKSIKFIKFERIGLKHWNLYEIRVFDIDMFLQQLSLSYINAYERLSSQIYLIDEDKLNLFKNYSKKKFTFCNNAEAALIKHNSSNDALTSLNKAKYGYLHDMSKDVEANMIVSNDIEAKLEENSHLNESSDDTRTGFISLQDEFINQKMLLTTWSVHEYSQLKCLYENYVIASHDFSHANNTKSSSQGNLHKEPNIVDIWMGNNLIESIESNKSGVLAYEVIKQTEFVLRQSASIKILKDCRRRFYPFEIKSFSNSKDDNEKLGESMQTTEVQLTAKFANFASFLMTIFPQTRLYLSSLSKYELSSIIVYYYPHYMPKSQRLNVETIESNVVLNVNSNKVFEKPNIELFETLGTLEDDFQAILKRLDENVMCHDFMLEAASR